MMLKLQKRLAGSILRCSPKRAVFDPARLEDIKEAITKTDMRLLIGEGAVWRLQKKGVSRARANKRKVQKSKGLRRGEGKRKGKYTARAPKKLTWMNKIRAQRSFLKYLRENSLIKNEDFKDLYSRSKGGYFRSIKHIKLHIHEQNLLLKPQEPVATPADKTRQGTAKKAQAKPEAQAKRNDAKDISSDKANEKAINTE
jgi:large subunit ribosomal protein L19e